MAGSDAERQARQVAARHLARRDLSRQRLGERLRRTGVGEEVAEQVVDALAEAGYVDDARLARAQAEQLAARGYGDALIADRLERAGIEPEVILEALGELEPEEARARALTHDERNPRQLASTLSRRGFSADAVEGACDALAPMDGAGGTELR